MNNVTGGIFAVATAIVGVAIVAVIVSRNSQTPSVISAATEGFASILKVAVSPVSVGGGGGGW